METLPVANTKLGIEFEFEHVNMLKFQMFETRQDTFTFSLPQQRPVLVSANVQNFLTLSSAKKRCREKQIARPSRQLPGLPGFHSCTSGPNFR